MMSSDPHAWLYPIYAGLGATRGFGLLSPAATHGRERTMRIPVTLWSIALLATAGASAGCGDETASSVIDRDPTYTVNAAQLYAEFDQNPITAEQKYGGRYVETEGLIKDIESSPPALLLGMNMSTHSGLRAEFPESEASQLANVRKGDRTTVICRVQKHVVAWVYMTDCRRK